MVSIDNLKVEFGVRPLFQDVNFVINAASSSVTSGPDGKQSPTLNSDSLTPLV